MPAMRIRCSCLLICLAVLGLLYPKVAAAYYEPVNLGCVAASSEFAVPVQQIFKATRASDLQHDPTHLSMLITVAVNQRYGATVAARDIASLMSPVRDGQTYSFLDIKQVLKRVGYTVFAYRINPAASHLPLMDDVGFLIDQTVVANSSIITLLFAATQDKKYLLYANGLICAMSVQQFEQRFGNSVFLRLD